jgi:hypothetical protein
MGFLPGMFVDYLDAPIRILPPHTSKAFKALKKAGLNPIPADPGVFQEVDRAKMEKMRQELKNLCKSLKL